MLCTVNDGSYAGIVNQWIVGFPLTGALAIIPGDLRCEYSAKHVEGCGGGCDIILQKRTGPSN